MEHKLNDTVYMIVYWAQVGEVVIMKVKIKGIKIEDDINIMYYVENSRFSVWEYDTKVFSTIDDALASLRERIVE